MPTRSDNLPQGKYKQAVTNACTNAIQLAKVKSASNSVMIAGSAMLSCPLSAVTSSVASDATDSDNQRRLRDWDPTVCGEIMKKLRRAGLASSVQA
jgi:hypothetical protein